MRIQWTWNYTEKQGNDKATPSINRSKDGRTSEILIKEK